MDIGIVGAGISGLSAAWSLRRAGHRVHVFERNYKPGGRLNSRRKAGLVVDHGDRFIARNAPVLREIIMDCGLHGELAQIQHPIYHMRPDGTFAEQPYEAVDRNLVTFADGLLMLPEALRRSVGGFYSIQATSIEWQADRRKFLIRTSPPMREVETLLDGVILACAASEAVRLTRPVHSLLRPAFLETVSRVRYTRSLVLMAALDPVELDPPFYGIYPPDLPEAVLSWFAFENLKCRGREVSGWSSVIAHTRPDSTEQLWSKTDDEIEEIMFEAARRLVPALPDRWRWARLKRWEISRLREETVLATHADCPATDDEYLLDFCGDYRGGDGAESAAESGRAAAESLVRRMPKPI